MFLKEYQRKVVDELRLFFTKALNAKNERNTLIEHIPENKRHLLNWVQDTFEGCQKSYVDQCKNGLGEYYPRIVMKVPLVTIIRVLPARFRRSIVFTISPTDQSNSSMASPRGPIPLLPANLGCGTLGT